MAVVGGCGQDLGRTGRPAEITCRRRTSPRHRPLDDDPPDGGPGRIRPEAGDIARPEADALCSSPRAQHLRRSWLDEAGKPSQVRHRMQWLFGRSSSSRRTARGVNGDSRPSKCPRRWMRGSWVSRKGYCALAWPRWSPRHGCHGLLEVLGCVVGLHVVVRDLRPARSRRGRSSPKSCGRAGTAPHRRAWSRPDRVVDTRLERLPWSRNVP